MIDSKKSAKDIQEVFEKLNESRIFTIHDIDYDFPEMNSIEFDALSLYHLSQNMQQKYPDKKPVKYGFFFSKLLQKSINNGETEFEIYTSKSDEVFPWCIEAKDKE